jgi:hypothetical protein
MYFCSVDKDIFGLYNAVEVDHNPALLYKTTHYFCHLNIMNTKKIFFVTAIAVLILAVAAVGNVFAETYGIIGNGSGSNNTVDVSQQNNTTVNQNNNANINNNVNVNCNTGNNSSSANTGGSTSTTTGNCATNVNINNNVNNNSATVACPTCPKVSPTPKVSPAPDPRGGGGNNGGNGGGNNGGGSSSSSGGGLTPAILGSTGVLENTMLYALGMTFVVSGLYTFRRNYLA